MWNAPQMPEFVSSLPISGVDGTMRKRHVAQGSAHVKTGYIQNVRSIAGYVQTKSGERYAVAAIVTAVGSQFHTRYGRCNQLGLRQVIDFSDI